MRDLYYVSDAEHELRCFFPFRGMPSRYFVLYVGCYPTRRGRVLQGFTSSALWYNTIALSIPNAGFLFQNAQFRSNWEEKLAYLKKNL